MPLLKEEDENIRIDALNYLFFSGYRESTPEIKKLLKDPHNLVRSVARNILDAWGEDVPHRLYLEQEPSFFDKERKIVRSEFEKSGSRTVLLGGQLAGKVIVRIVDEP